MIKAVLFDLDGTLLPMDQNKFVKGYFGMLCKKLAPYGYEAESMVDGIWKATGAMIQNDGSRTNEEVFWEVFAGIMGEEILEYRGIFDEFYVDEFKNARQFCGFTPKAREVIDLVKEKGYRVVCATNPIFPSMATRHRMEFAGLSPEDFEYFTHYENSRYCKPNPEYYRQIMKITGLKPEECLMVGNDSTEDVAAATIGMKIFLLTDCLINDKNVDISLIPHGNFDDLKKFILYEINYN